MSAVHNSVETVNAAATAIVTAESRTQPTAVQKKRWGNCWSLYWCFGSCKCNKRIGHAVLVSEPAIPGAAALVGENMALSTTVLLPFITPPSSPASFFQSDPPSANQSPAGLLSLTSFAVNAYSPSGPATIFTVGPYAHETQLVSPPVLSTFTTEPSTASFTPPPEPVQLTTPSSPEVPFAQLVTSSLGRARRNSGINQKFSLSQYKFQPYALYQGSPVGNLVSPGSGVSNSGTSSPFPGKHPTIELCMEEVPKPLSSLEHLSTYKWGSRLSSGSLTPEGVEPAFQDGYPLQNQISEVESFANSETGSHTEDAVINHRVSFELADQGIPSCVAMDQVSPIKKVSEYLHDTVAESTTIGEVASIKIRKCCICCGGEASNKMPRKASEEEQCHLNHHSISLGLVKEFDFDHRKGEISDKQTLNSEWWTNEKVVGEDQGPHNQWTFLSRLHSGVS